MAVTTNLSDIAMLASAGARSYSGKRVFINDNNRQGKRRTTCKMSPEMLGASKRCITGGADEGFDIVGHIVLYSGLLYSMDGGMDGWRKELDRAEIER
jgi:hypothetical protein